MFPFSGVHGYENGCHASAAMFVDQWAWPLRAILPRVLSLRQYQSPSIWVPSRIMYSLFV